MEIQFEYFIGLIKIENWKIEKGLDEDLIIGKNEDYYFTLGDNHDSSDQAMFNIEFKENVIEKVFYEKNENIEMNIELFRNIKTNEYTGVVRK